MQIGWGAEGKSNQHNLLSAVMFYGQQAMWLGDEANITFEENSVQKHQISTFQLWSNHSVQVYFKAIDNKCYVEYSPLLIQGIPV